MRATCVTGVRISILTVVIALSGCAHYAPHAIYVPPEPVRGQSGAGGVRAAYVKTDPERGAPLVELHVVAEWSNGARLWNVIDSIAILREDWSPIQENVFLESPANAPKTIRFHAPAADGESRLRVLVDRSGAPQQQLALKLTMEEVHMPTAPVIDERARGAWVTATYPIWGLPRDLVDLPLTALNRFGLGKVYGGKSFDEPRPPVIGLYAAAGIAGAIWGAGWGFHEAGHHYMQSYLYATGGLLVGVGLGAGGVLALDAAWGATVNPLQVALLRTGIDDEYVKTADHVLPIRGAWTDDDVRKYDTLLRTHAYFPNWRYGVHEQTVSLPRDDQGESVWVVTRIEIVDAPGE